MSYLVATMKKFNANNLAGIDRHNLRKTTNHKNKQINNDLSYKNYDLVNPNINNIKADVETYIQNNKSTKKNTRKDAVLLCEWIISSDQAFFKGKPDTEVKKFFDVAVKYFKDRFGSDNIRYARVHLDETTPHMHLGIVPFDSNNKLSAKRVFNRLVLKDIQTQLAKEMNLNGQNLSRGEKGSKHVHLDTPQFKATMEQVKLKEQQLKYYETRLDELHTQNAKLIDENKELEKNRDNILEWLDQFDEIAKLKSKFKKYDEEVHSYKKGFFNKQTFYVVPEHIWLEEMEKLVIPRMDFIEYRRMEDRLHSMEFTKGMNGYDLLKSFVKSNNLEKEYREFRNSLDKYNENTIGGKKYRGSRTNIIRDPYHDFEKHRNNEILENNQKKNRGR